jgi:HK97 gp10 family phage protein
MIGAKGTGIPDLREALRGIVPKLRVRALRNALAAGARVVQRAARGAAPVLSAGAPAVRKGWRKPGTVRRAISVRTSRVARQAGNVGVFVNVRPAKGAGFKTTTARLFGVSIRRRIQTRASQRGARSPNDPFYWRFVNFGTRSLQARNFLQAGVNRLPDALQVFLATIGPAIAKLNRPKAPPP